MKSAVLIFSFLFLSFYAEEKLFEVPKGWPQPVYDFSGNPLTKNKIELGRALFYDPVLSANGIVSCASCHSPFSAFTHNDHALSHGIHDSIGTRNSPPLMNLAWQKLFMWDGAVNNLDVQPLAPISHPAEMGSSIKEIVEKLNASPFYRGLFYTAFHDSIVTGEHTLKAISQFLLTLVSANSKYDKFMRGELIFSDQESNGYKLFLTNCAACHTEPLFTSFEFANNGLPVDSFLHDTGRMKVTQNAKDSLKFKIPSLRNIEYTYPYMHDGRFKRLSDVLKHYTSGIVHSSTLSEKLEKPVVLSSNEKVDLIAFLLTLSDSTFVFNKEFQYPKELFFPSK